MSEERAPLSANEVIEMVEAIYALPLKERESKIKADYGHLETQYHSLFGMLLAPGFDMSRFRYMIRLKQAIENGQTTTEKASVKVGQDLFDVYVKDKVGGGGPI